MFRPDRFLKPVRSLLINKKDHRQKFDDGLAFYRTAGKIFRIDDCASQIIGRLLPIGVKDSIQKKRAFVDKSPLI
jgi:hypothetical protein